MKMNENNQKKLKEVYEYLLNNATDFEITYIFMCIAQAAEVAAKKSKGLKNGKN